MLGWLKVPVCLHVLHVAHPELLLGHCGPVKLLVFIEREACVSRFWTGNKPTCLLVYRYVLSVDQEVLLLLFHLIVHGCLHLFAV